MVDRSTPHHTSARSNPAGPARAARAYLDVPYSEKDQAKALGARWDQQARRWYDPRPPSPGLDRWAARPPVPDLLPGEDRTLGSGLFVDLVPSSCWFTNVRSCVTEQDWERLRAMVTTRAGNRCEICHAERDPDTRRLLEVHERWTYDQPAGVQALRRLICLCTWCHRTTHFGLALLRNNGDEAFEHLRRVTGMTEEQAARHVDDAFEVWQQRSRRTWTLDLSMLTDAGITLTTPPAAADRPDHARRELDHSHDRRPADGDLRPVDARPATPAASARPGAPAAAPAEKSPANIVAAAGQRAAQAAVSREPAEREWVDLAGNAAGVGVSQEASRRARENGDGQDRSWWVGAEGEIRIGELLDQLAQPSWWDKARRRAPEWRVLHSITLYDAHGRARGNIDHLLIGPPGVVTINTKHHHGARAELDGDALTVNGRPVDHVRKARSEALRVHEYLGAALTAAGHTDLAGQIPVRPAVVVAGARLIVRRRADGVLVLMPRELVHILRQLPSAELERHVCECVYDLARRSTTWTRARD